MTDHAAYSRRFGAREHRVRAVKTALLHELQFHDVGGLRLDDGDKARVVHNRFVGHDRNAGGLAAYPRHAGDIVCGYRLFHQL